MYYVKPADVPTPVMYVYWDPTRRLAVQVCGAPGRHGRCLRPSKASLHGACHVAPDGFTWTTPDARVSHPDQGASQILNPLAR